MKEETVIFFDGVCNLCNRAVQFVIKHDPKGHFKFASLHSDYAKKYLRQFGDSAPEMYSLILIENGRIYHKSTGALRIARHLSGFWKLGWIFLIVPRFIRDGVYDYIARHRYKWFGKRNECMIPNPEIQQRFLSS